MLCLISLELVRLALELLYLLNDCLCHALGTFRSVIEVIEDNVNKRVAATLR